MTSTLAISAKGVGKVILGGEHAVVYGAPAIALPVPSLATEVSLKETPTPGIHIFLDHYPGPLVLGQSEDPAPAFLSKAVSVALEALEVTDTPSVSLSIHSSIPIASGFGSSGAVSVAVIQAFFRYFGRNLTPEELRRLAHEAEKAAHGQPSGVDTAVIAYESPIWFRRETPVETLPIGRPLTFLVAETGLRSSTREVVNYVEKKWRRDPDSYETLFSRIGETVTAMRPALGDPQALGALMDLNHQLLVSMGVSSPETERLVMAARESGAWGAKLTGAGWGGNVLVLTPPELEQAIATALITAGAQHVHPLTLGNA